MAETPQQLQTLLLQLLPADHSALGNGNLWTQFQASTQAAGTTAVTQDDFNAAREALVASGKAVKGRGRGGSTARATGAVRPEFDLHSQAVTPDMLLPGRPAAFAPAVAKPKAVAAAPRADTTGAPQVISYRHPDRRKNNPEVGLVSTASDPEQPKTAWAYDPHLDPALQFDSARAGAEKLIDDALAGNDPAAMRQALEALRRMGAPYLQWTGKAERTSFEVDTVSLHVHERIDAMSILSAVSKRQNTIKKGAAGASGTCAGGQKQAQSFQPGLFEAPFESVPLRSALDFYKHDRGWANRLVAGDSLLVMNSLLQKEGMAGQVQMIYLDPPYGIKYGSNFQPFTNKRDVKDRSDADLTQEPEMIKAFRDTWELGIHSYLTYLRDRLLLAKDLLSETGSVFVQISDENLHHVRELCDEVFGCDQYVSLINYHTTSSQTSAFLASVGDYILWYAKDRKNLKFRRPYLEKTDESGQYRWTNELGEAFRYDNFTSQTGGDSTIFNVDSNGATFRPKKGGWKTNRAGAQRLTKAGRLRGSGDTVSYIRFLHDFGYSPIDSTWTDTRISGFSDAKNYVVQTAVKVVERCMLMTTDPGDLVFDPTCGSGTTAYVAEKWGRRWITCDTSRVAITLAKQRLMTASFDYFALRYPQEGLKGGFIYKTVPHVTLKSIANNAEIDAIYERLHPGLEGALAALNAGFAPPPGRLHLSSLRACARGRSWLWEHRVLPCWNGKCRLTRPPTGRRSCRSRWPPSTPPGKRCRPRWIAALPATQTTKPCTTSPSATRPSCACAARSRWKPCPSPPCYHLRSCLRKRGKRKAPIWPI